MAAARCSLHNIDYPQWYNRCAVPGCDEELNYFNNVEPDPDFKDMVAYHTHLADDNEAEAYREPGHLVVVAGPRVTHPDLQHLGDAAITNVDVIPAKYQGHLWVSHEVLIKAGYLYLEDFKVVMIQSKFYELQAHVGRSTLTHGIKGGVWWIVEIDPAAYIVPDHIPEEVITHGEEDSV